MQASSPRHARNLRDPEGGPRSHRRVAHIPPLLANVGLGALFPPAPHPSYPRYAVFTGVPMSKSNSWMSRPLSSVDPEIAQAIANEEKRQHDGLEMIASENFVSRAVLEAAGTVFTNKYAEGYPSKRYYGGCEFADVVENLARDRAKKIFGAEHANVQPHSGSQANAAAYMSLCVPGDTILGLDLAHGGHLTHGHKLNFSGKLYRVVGYQVRRDTETVDYDELEATAQREKPKMIIGGGRASSKPSRPT